MKKNLLMLIALLVVGLSVSAQNKAVYTTKAGAIQGYDAVSCFKEAAAVKGSTAFTYEWNDSKWLFSSKENLDSFKLDPAKYAPQYGGYCAYGLSENHKSPTNPEAFTIVNGKLYLNYNLEVKKLWMPAKEMRISKADSLWPIIKND